MRSNIYFKTWINKYPGLTRICLILILFAGMAQFASFGLIQAHVISFYGAQSEDISFAFQISYAGIISFLPIQFRTQRYFNTRNYLIIAFLIGIFLNLGCMATQNLVLFSFLRFFMGAVTCTISACVLIILFSTLPIEKATLIGVSIFFSLVLTCGIIVGIGASWIVVRWDWTVFYYALIGLQIVAMVICILLFKLKIDRKPLPLYQIDWIGGLLFAFGVVTAVYIFIYGPKRYWWSDQTVRYASFFSISALSLYFYRKTTIRHPLIDMNVFKYPKFIFAIGLMLVFWCVKDSINLIYGYAASVLGWDAVDVVQSGLFNILGVILATLIAIRSILRKRENLPKILLVGFSLMCFYHLWFYFHVTPALSFNELCLPIFVQGLACGFLFVPITIFCSASVPKSTGMTAIIICAYTRFCSTLISMSGLYTLQLYYTQNYKYQFLSKLTIDNEILVQRQSLYQTLLSSKGLGKSEAIGISNMILSKSSALQSQLLAIRSIFMIGAIVAVIVIILLCCFAVIIKFKTAGKNKLESRAQ